jgi:hypothetical protein
MKLWSGERLRAGTVLTALLAAAACSDSPSEPADDALPLEIHVLVGDGQRGLGGLPLPLEILIRVTDAGGKPKAGVPVELAPHAGSGSTEIEQFATDSNGLLQGVWTLGDAEMREQRVTISLPADPQAEPVIIGARALRSDEVDVIVVRGAQGPLKGVVLLEEIDEGGWIQIQQVREAEGPVIPLQPFAPAHLRILVLPTRNRPGLFDAAWTPGIDTVVVDLEPPVDVDAVVHVYRGEFEATRSVVLQDMATTAEVWEENGAGLRWGEVELKDLTGGGPVTLNSAQACSRSGEAARLVIEYLTSIDSGGYWGYGCTTGIAYMGLGPQPGSTLLAHELGHVFSLAHTTVGLMVPNPPGRSLTDGEIFKAHFDSRSALNSILDGQPAELRILCAGRSNFRNCLPMNFRLGR